MLELNRIRQEIKLNFQAPTSQYSISCNGIKFKSCSGLRLYQIINDNISNTLGKLKESQDRKLSYCTSEWAKLTLFYMFHKSFHESCDSAILNLFELGRNPNSRNVSVKELKGTVGLLQDQFLSILWVLVVTLDARLLLFKVNVDKTAVSRKIQRIHEICAQNTDSLRNTNEIAKDSAKKAQWWKLRKSLDSELISICSDLNEDLFSSVSVRFWHSVRISLIFCVGTYYSK